MPGRVETDFKTGASAPAPCERRLVAAPFVRFDGIGGRGFGDGSRTIATIIGLLAAKVIRQSDVGEVYLALWGGARATTFGSALASPVASAAS